MKRRPKPAKGKPRTFEMFDTSAPRPCPKCKAVAIVPLPPMLLAAQPDDTTHVCHPALGGCNHGFSVGP